MGNSLAGIAGKLAVRKIMLRKLSLELKNISKNYVVAELNDELDKPDVADCGMRSF